MPLAELFIQALDIPKYFDYINGMKRILCAILLSALAISSAFAAPFASKSIPFNSDFTKKFASINFQISKHDFNGTTNDRILAINAFVNKSVAYTTESDDVWTNPADTLASGKGDCEDFALLKIAYLFQNGFKPADVSLMIVTLPGHKDYHAVVAVKTDGGYVVLDSATNRVLPDYRSNYIPVFQIVDGKGYISGK
jgi:predicted transglutaminase-like cysteine proteinase